MVVNGACEADWPAVAELARSHPAMVVPSFGYHPWYLDERTPEWERELARRLDTTPHAVIGEIGLDRWMLDQPDRWRALLAAAGQAKHDPPSLAEQESVFLPQLRLAAERNLPASIHCLHAFGRLRELLEANPRPECGWLLHSYGGPPEMVPQFASLGAYFSFPGSFLNPGREMKIAAFAAVPAERLLLETDAPDQCLPPAMDRYALTSPQDGKRTNHPANIRAVYEGYAESQGLELSALSAQLERNFRALFGALLRA
jgi:TatD DNase family protein